MDREKDLGVDRKNAMAKTSAAVNIPRSNDRKPIDPTHLKNSAIIKLPQNSDVS